MFIHEILGFTQQFYNKNKPRAFQCRPATNDCYYYVIVIGLTYRQQMNNCIYDMA